jgi:hypothetical protein
MAKTTAACVVARAASRDVGAMIAERDPGAWLD